MKNNYETLLDAVKDLKLQGFSYDFYLEEDGIYCPALNQKFSPSEVAVTDYYRFEGMSYPGDNDIVFTVKTNNGHKGVLVCAYGVYAEVNELIHRLKIEKQTVL